jgi:hypothetical protein
VLGAGGGARGGGWQLFPPRGGQGPPPPPPPPPPPLWAHPLDTAIGAGGGFIPAQADGCGALRARHQVADRAGRLQCRAGVQVGWGDEVLQRRKSAVAVQPPCWRWQASQIQVAPAARAYPPAGRWPEGAKGSAWSPPVCCKHLLQSARAASEFLAGDVRRSTEAFSGQLLGSRWVAAGRLSGAAPPVSWLRAGRAGRRVASTVGCIHASCIAAQTLKHSQPSCWHRQGACAHCRKTLRPCCLKLTVVALLFLACAERLDVELVGHPCSTPGRQGGAVVTPSRPPAGSPSASHEAASLWAPAGLRCASRPQHPPARSWLTVNAKSEVVNVRWELLRAVWAAASHSSTATR